MILGIHGSVRGGLQGPLDEAAQAGCEALQMLPYKRHEIPSAGELEAFRKRRESSRLRRLVVHSRFVPSLASSQRERRARSVELLAAELGLADGLGAEAYILHAGAYSEGATAEQGLSLAARSIVEAAAKMHFKGIVLIENVPGGGRRLCGSLEEISRLYESLSAAKVKAGVCFDTAHAWSAGYEISSAEGMLKFLSRAHRLFGAAPRAFHVNDTRALFGSHREDHAHWGEGYLGTEGLRTLLERPEHADVVGIVETPKTPGGDSRNLGFLADVLAARSKSRA